MSTVGKTNMCARAFRGLMSLCTARKIMNQEDCTHYIKHSFVDQCTFYRPDLDGGCDNWWAQTKTEMPAEVIEFYKNYHKR